MIEVTMETLDTSASRALAAGITTRDAILRRRTFAIISHPDAGKTTLTEQLLFNAGAIEMAGAVRPKKSRAHAASDWMAIEQARGISITSTALQFEYGDVLLNLLDTPGHADFSEDTYRTLMAVDSAVMVLDAAKGIEPRTRKLFEVCRNRGIPILTFINKIDQPGRDPLELIDEIEKELAIHPSPMEWPVGAGSTLAGVVGVNELKFYGYQRFGFGGADRSPEGIPWSTGNATAGLSSDVRHRVLEELALLEAACEPFEIGAFHRGDLTPVYFGSALHNFRVGTFLDAIAKWAPPPQQRTTIGGETSVDPLRDPFSAFVFKIQANMDPQHRDTMAFLRICSGRFERDMMVHHPRLGKKIRMTRMHRLFARDRTLVDEAFAGDVVGIANPGLFQIGDTVAEVSGVEFPHIPSFEPEYFATLICEDITRAKQFRKGIRQLAEEGVVQIYHSVSAARREPILGAVGQLQFDVVESRMWQEYNTKVRISPLKIECARWPQSTEVDLSKFRWPSQGVEIAEDFYGHRVCLFQSGWHLRTIAGENPKIRFLAIAPANGRAG